MESAVPKQVIDAHYWAIHNMLEAVAALTPEQYDREIASSFPNIRLTVHHMLNAEEFLGGFLAGQRVSGTPPEAVLSAGAMRERWASVEQLVRKAVEAGRDWDRSVPFRLRGGEFSVPAWQVLFQMLQHGQYHRGQVTVMLRQVGGTTSKGDPITYFIQAAES